jgi:formate dehydrogenase alpha subunit
LRKKVRLTINGMQILVEEGTTIYEAARSAGIVIPSLCYHPAISPLGSCRVCVVEVEGARNLPASCSTPVSEGMSVRTETERVRNARRGVLDLILANHPQDCMTCEKNGDCRLQDYAYQYGIKKSSYEGAKRGYPLDDSNPFFERDHEKCILCGRCVNVCAEKTGYNVYNYGFRGFETKIVAGLDGSQEESNCVFCGNCITLCPTGALQPKISKGKGRSYETKEVTTVCPYCGVGCMLKLVVKDQVITGIKPAKGAANDNLLCVKGRFGLDYVQHPQRLTSPLVRKNGRLTEVSWEEAISYAAQRFQEIKERYGPRALAGISSAKCSNEENYLMQKFVRCCLGSNNVDNSARLCHASTISGLLEAFGSGAATNSIAELEHAKVLFVIGSNTTETHPVIGFKIRQAKRRGTRIIVADPRRTELAAEADVFLQQLPGTDIALLNGMLHIIVEEGLVDSTFIAERTEGFAEVKELVKRYTPSYVEKITGVPAEELVKAARMYAGAQGAAILYAMGITQHTTGTDNVRSIANLALATGNVGRENTGVYPLRGQNNVQGACDMAALPGYLPGYQKLSDGKIRKKFSLAWGVEIPADPGLNIMEMLDEAQKGELKGLYILGENPMLSNPDLQSVEKALGNLEFLVVQDIFLTETARLAHVVLPGSTFAEKEGTYVNTERRVQLAKEAVAPPGDSRPDWEIIGLLGEEMGYPFKYASPREIMKEISSLTPSYAGITYERLEEKGIQWPCPEEDHPGTPYLHREKFARGRGCFAAVEHQPPAEMPDSEYPYILVTGRHLYHYHTGTMSRRSSGLETHRPEAYLEINQETAASLGVTEGSYLKVVSRRGEIRIIAHLTERVPERILFVPFHYREAAANLLTNPKVDPKSGIPELKVCAARIEVLEGGRQDDR